MVPNAEMSTEERACCRTMKGQCGQMDNMPEGKHSRTNRSLLAEDGFLLPITFAHKQGGIGEW
jgi:hypothetical protein